MVYCRVCLGSIVVKIRTIKVYLIKKYKIGNSESNYQYNFKAGTSTRRPNTICYTSLRNCLNINPLNPLLRIPY